MVFDGYPNLSWLLTRFGWIESFESESDEFARGLDVTVTHAWCGTCETPDACTGDYDVQSRSRATWEHCESKPHPCGCPAKFSLCSTLPCVSTFSFGLHPEVRCCRVSRYTVRGFRRDHEHELLHPEALRPVHVTGVLERSARFMQTSVWPFCLIVQKKL